MSAITANQLARELSPKYLQLIILPTEKCNFRCTYCYEDFAIGKMSPPIRSALKLFISKRIAGLTHFTLSWFGGEPLLATDVIEDIGNHAIHECRKQCVTFSADITTNAYRLDRALFDKLIEFCVTRYQISLDGDTTGHDQTRKLANGGGTFEQIWANLMMMRDSSHQFSATLRLHLTPGNLSSIESLVRRIAGTFGSDPRFHVFFKAVEKLGGKSDGEMKTLSDTDAADSASRFQALLADAKIQSASANGKSESDTRVGASTDPYVCYAARPNSLVVRADGTLAKCTVMFNDTRNSIGRLRPDGTIQVDNSRLALWMRGFRSLNVDELGCPAVALPKLPVEQPVLFQRSD